MATAKRALKKILHINQHIIRANGRTGATDPVITVKTYKSNEYAHEAIIFGQDGLEAARIIYRPNDPLSCGAKVWVELTGGVELVRHADTEGESTHVRVE